MENEKEIAQLIESFVEYRKLLTPIEQNLSDFALTYENLQQDIQKLNKSLDGSMQNRLEMIYKDLASQLEKSKDLAIQVDGFKQKTDDFSKQMQKFVEVFSKIESKIEKIDEIESKATSQIEKLNELIEQKRKIYDVKELEKNLETYNQNVQKVSEFINTDIAKVLDANNQKIEQIKNKNESVFEVLSAQNSSIEKLIESYTQSNNLLRKIVEKQDVDEQFVFDIVDKWAKDRRIKTKK